MDILNTRPSWLTALLPLLAMWQYGDRGLVRGELYRMAMSADAAAQSAEALKRIAERLDCENTEVSDCREELRAIAQTALLDIERVPPSAPVAMIAEWKGRLR
jgi:hypothetical protein